MKIAVFDSGVGGLTVLHDARRLMPQHDYLYYADTDNVPYGSRQKADVQHLVLGAVTWLAAQGVAALVMACNTATSVAVEELRHRFSFPVIGMEPAVKPAVSRHAGETDGDSGRRRRRVLVAATPLTLREEKFNQLVAAVDQEGIVDSWPLPDLVGYAERGEFRPDVVAAYLRTQSAGFELQEYGTLVLGCTHFLYFLPHFRRLFPDADIVDGNEGTVRQLQRQIASIGTPGDVPGNSGRVAFFESGRLVVDPARFWPFIRQYESGRGFPE
jgi:glutamate racemase